MLRSDYGGEFLGTDFTDFVNDEEIIHDLTCPYTSQQNGMAEREMRMVVEAVRAMLLHMGVHHHWWHLALQQAAWVRNCLEHSSLQPRTTPHQLLTGKKPEPTLVHVWECMVQSMVLEQQRGGKRVQKAQWGLHLGVSPESKGWEVLDLTDNKVVTTVEGHFLRNAVVGCVEGEQLNDGSSSDVVEVVGEPNDDEGELSVGEQSIDRDVVEDKVDEPKLRHSTHSNLGKPRKKLSYHACLPPTSYSTLLDDAQADVDVPEVDPDMHADPEHRRDITTMMVKEALASWKDKAVTTVMDEEIRSLIANGTWELVERPRGVNIMNNPWVQMTKYHINDTVAREKARLVVKGFTQVYSADYHKNSRQSRAMSR
ncbi:unnamed protein product [Closterium sp. NIES-54]